MSQCPLPKPFAAVLSRRRFPPPDRTPQRLQGSSPRREDDRPKGDATFLRAFATRWVCFHPVIFFLIWARQLAAMGAPLRQK
jgi:hypothetical protein